VATQRSSAHPGSRSPPLTTPSARRHRRARRSRTRRNTGSPPRSPSAPTEPHFAAKRRPTSPAQRHSSAGSNSS
jgi:hypothetical protein